MRLAKFFSAGAAGGPAMLEAIAAPFAHLGIRFIPTGGVSEKTIPEWLEVKSVVAVGGTWSARTEDIREGRFRDIAAEAKASVSAARQALEARS